jgi:1,4-alpha-glucan branching enzyme
MTAGDFNNWDPDALTKQQVNGQNVWTGFFSMPRGEHKYMFVVNGEKWVTDPLANMYQDDGFGNKNAIIYL